MIELTPLARPYAKALFASALESKNIDEMASELKTMALASKTDGVINTIENPVLSRQDVVTVLVDIFDESISSYKRLNMILGFMLGIFKGSLSLVLFAGIFEKFISVRLYELLFEHSKILVFLKPIKDYIFS